MIKEPTTGVELALYQDSPTVAGPELLANPMRVPVVTFTGAESGHRFYVSGAPADDYYLTLRTHGELWPRWLLVEARLRINGNPHGSATAPVPLAPSDHPTAMLHFYRPAYRPLGQVGHVPPAVFTVTMRVPR
jgi:hypothetical protein